MLLFIWLPVSKECTQKYISLHNYDKVCSSSYRVFRLRITKVKGCSTETVHFLSHVGKANMRLKCCRIFDIQVFIYNIAKKLLLLMRILDLPTRCKKCNVSKLHPLTFVIFQPEHPVVAFRRLCSSLFLCFSFSLFLLKKRRIHKRSLRSLRKAIVTIDCFWLKLPQL